MQVKMLSRIANTDGYVIDIHKGTYFNIESFEKESMAVISDNMQFGARKSQKWAIVDLKTGLVIVYGMTKKQLMENWLSRCDKYAQVIKGDSYKKMVKRFDEVLAND